MKRKWIMHILLVVLLIGAAHTPSHAQVAWLDGGLVGDLMIAGTHEYQELVFITGEPVLLKGTVRLPVVPTNSDAYSLGYQFNLTNAAKGITLVRSVTYDVTKVTNANITQTAYEKKLKQYQETITTPAGEYVLGKYIFQDSRIYDNTPAVDYFSGNIIAERTYYLNGDYANNAGHVTFIIDAKPIVGYEHNFGNNETMVVRQEIQSYTPNPGYNPTIPGSKEFNIWTGVVDIGMGSNKTINYVYQNTDPQSISFRGSYFKVSSEENVLTYTYDLPFSNNGTVDLTSTRRNIGRNNLSKNVILESKALITPKIRDIGGHWAENEIFLLTSLEVFDVEKEYFVPSATISRLDFGKAMVVAVNGPLPTPSSTEVIRRLRPGVETPYLDVVPTDPDYHYIQFIKDNNIMAGKNFYSKGDEPLTRAEAITIMIKVLGLEYMAPAPPYRTTFADDAAIGEWSKDFIYMANEIGLVSGTPEGYINPNRWVRKDEAAAMINSFITHLKDNITYDYREKILNR